jgi:nucleotide-binding universal stress UspA family protein
MTDHSPAVRPVLVDTDGSDESRAAVRWAADEAERLDVPLHVVHSYLWPYYDVPLGRPLGAPPGAGLQAAAKRVLAEAVAEAKTIAPATGGLRGALLGSTTHALLHHAACPVFVQHAG